MVDLCTSRGRLMPQPRVTPCPYNHLGNTKIQLGVTVHSAYVTLIKHEQNSVAVLKWLTQLLGVSWMGRAEKNIISSSSLTRDGRVQEGGGAPRGRRADPADNLPGPHDQRDQGVGLTRRRGQGVRAEGGEEGEIGKRGGDVPGAARREAQTRADPGEQGRAQAADTHGCRDGVRAAGRRTSLKGWGRVSQGDVGVINVSLKTAN